MMTAAARAEEFRRRLDAAAEATEAELDALLSPGALPGEITRPARLLEAMRYATLGGGKRLRPFLVIESARMFGVDGGSALRTACALEMIHCYSLVHDDLPAMDDDDLRRGRPTAHKAFDEATAILAGDGLLTYAFDVVADPATHADAGVRAALVLALARASGLGGMVGGQALDLAAETAATPLTQAETLEMQAMKTGALLRFAVEAGAILGGATPAQAQALDRYGRALGAAFQVADDILDAEGDTAALGKRAGKDAERGKATLVGLLGLEGARARCDQLVEEATAALADTGLGPRVDVLAEAARFVAARRS
jgi:farnesyl diphosphate synthase